MPFNPVDEVSVTLKVVQWNLILRLLRDLVAEPQAVIQAISDQAQAEELRRERAKAKVQLVPTTPPAEPPVNVEKIKRPARGAAAASEQTS